MTENENNRVRATFILDMALFDLLKLASQIERRPMSHIVEQLLSSYLDQYSEIMKVMKKELHETNNKP